MLYEDWPALHTLKREKNIALRKNSQNYKKKVFDTHDWSNEIGLKVRLNFLVIQEEIILCKIVLSNGLVDSRRKFAAPPKKTE